MNQSEIKKAQHFIMLGYQDYIASRFLLNHDYIIQGATLASSAVEKYLKAFLLGLGKPIKYVHLDALDKLKAAFLGTSHESIFDYLDDLFLETLGDAYSLRYYNGLINPRTVGFFINQFIGELDYTINSFERLIKFSYEDGSEWESHYRAATRERNKDLLENNYVLQGIEKIDFMQRKSQAYAIHVDPKKMEVILIQLHHEMNVRYPGHIMLIDAVIN